jgi:hypothetical protein
MEKVVKFEFTVDVPATNILDNVTAEIDPSLGELGGLRRSERRITHTPSPNTKVTKSSKGGTIFLATPHIQRVRKENLSFPACLTCACTGS